MEILTKLDGVLLLAGYFVVLMFLVRFISEKGTKESYLVADRKMPWWIAQKACRAVPIHLAASAAFFAPSLMAMAAPSS